VACNGSLGINPPIGSEVTQYVSTAPELRAPSLTFETQASSELIDADPTIMSFALQHSKRDEAAGHMMQLGALRACLTAAQPELVLAGADHFLDLGANGIQAAYFSGRKRQAIGGIVLGVVSADQDLQTAGQPAAFGPIRVPPMVTHRVSIEAAILSAHTSRTGEKPYTGRRSWLEKTHARLSIAVAKGLGMTVSSRIR
jgi:hypothetical protein